MAKLLPKFSFPSSLKTFHEAFHRKIDHQESVESRKIVDYLIDKRIYLATETVATKFPSASRRQQRQRDKGHPRFPCLSTDTDIKGGAGLTMEHIRFL